MHELRRGGKKIVLSYDIIRKCTTLIKYLSTLRSLVSNRKVDGRIYNDAKA